MSFKCDNLRLPRHFLYDLLIFVNTYYLTNSTRLPRAFLPIYVQHLRGSLNFFMRKLICYDDKIGIHGKGTAS